MSMENQISNWNGFKVHGDTSELDRIVEQSGMISLDLNDITNTLSVAGENNITVGHGKKISDAFKAAVERLPFLASKVERLAIQFYIKESQPDLSELSDISKALSTCNNNLQLMWGYHRNRKS